MRGVAALRTLTGHCARGAHEPLELFQPSLQDRHQCVLAIHSIEEGEHLIDVPLDLRGPLHADPTQEHVRPGFDQDVTLRSDQLGRLAEPLASCVVAALAGRPFGVDLARVQGTGPDDPYEGYANYNLGIALLDLGQCSEAKPYLDAARHLEPDRHEPKDALKQVDRCIKGQKGKGKP